MTWAQATASATTIGGALATTTTQLELDFVRLHLITDGTVCWLGGTIDCSGANDVCCTNCVWRWSNGETFDLSWYGWNPDNGYTTERLVTNGTTFDDMCSPCSVQDFRPPSIIEWSADCNSDGIVDYGQCHDGTLPDYNSNNIPDICEQPRCQDADITNNQIIDGADLGALLAFWGPVNPVLPQADVNRDGQVNGADIGLLLSHWGPCP
jgi:hypothetical protein